MSFKRNHLYPIWLSILLFVSLSGCSKELDGEGSGTGSGPIVLDPLLEAESAWTKGITFPTGDNRGLNREYSIYASAYYIDLEFPLTNGDYFTGELFDYDSSVGGWTCRTDSGALLYWPLAGRSNGLDFLSVAVDTSVLKFSDSMVWSGQSPDFKVGERNVHGVKMFIPECGDTTEVLYGVSQCMCGDGAPARMSFKHTQCCLEFRIRADVDDILTLSRIIVEDAFTSGECCIETHPVEKMVWNFECSEPHDRDVPNVVEGTAVGKDSVLVYDMVLPPQPRKDITLFFHQGPSLSAVYTTTTNATKWVAGKKYIFEINVKFGEIVVIPSVVAWTETDENRQNIEV